jgi:hypothetical protein
LDKPQASSDVCVLIARKSKRRNTLRFSNRRAPQPLINASSKAFRGATFVSKNIGTNFMTSSITALLSIFGVIVGAMLQWWFARRGTEHKHFLELRNRAYADFLEVTSHLVSNRRAGKHDGEIELLARLTDAKARICIYGDEVVIQHLAAFFSAGASFETESGILAFTRFCLDIRKSVGVKDSSNLGPDISQLLFNIRPNSG